MFKILLIAAAAFIFSTSSYSATEKNGTSMEQKMKLLKKKAMANKKEKVETGYVKLLHEVPQNRIKRYTFIA